jgi:hypothetical protein
VASRRWAALHQGAQVRASIGRATICNLWPGSGRVKATHVTFTHARIDESAKENENALISTPARQLTSDLDHPSSRLRPSTPASIVAWPQTICFASAKERR